MAEDRTGVVARLDALEAAHKGATVPEPFWERCECLAGLGEIPSVSDCHQAGLCAMRQRDHERDRAMSALLAVARGVLARHEPITHRAHPGATFCGECSDYEEGYLREYPCDTVEAVAAALGEA